MPRQPGLWFRESTGYYSTTSDGVQHKLLPTEKKSEGMLKKLLRELGSGRPQPTQLAPEFSTRLVGELHVGLPHRGQRFWMRGRQGSADFLFEIGEGIYKFEDGKLVCCYELTRDKDRPKEFASTPGIDDKAAHSKASHGLRPPHLINTILTHYQKLGVNTGSDFKHGLHS